MDFYDEVEYIAEQLKLYPPDYDNCDLISKEDVVSAFIILNYSCFNNDADIFLGCAAINLLNAYAKLVDSELGFHFWRHLNTIGKGIENLGRSENIKVYYGENDLEHRLIILFRDFQFGFRCEKNNELINKISEQAYLKWDGIEKRHYAKTILNHALVSAYISNVTLSGKDLRSMIKSEISDYIDTYEFTNGELIKSRGDYVNFIDPDKYSKNYLRIKLHNYKDRPVIFTGIFKQIHDKYVTFTTIRPYIRACKTLTICDHINILRSDIESVYDISLFEKNRKYYIIGSSYPYGYNRMGIKLATGYSFTPIIKAIDFAKIPESCFSECERINIDEFIKGNRIHL